MRCNLNNAHCAEDPAVWGYLPLNGRKSFEPDEGSAVPPFQLLLVGSQYLGVPDELEHMVTIYRDLPYKGFYDIIANCDIVLPAFADNSCERHGYLHHLMNAG